MPKKKTTEDLMRDLVALHLDLPPARITLGAGLWSDLGADSLDGLEMLMAVEDEFGIEIGDPEADSIETFGDAVALVERLCA